MKLRFKKYDTFGTCGVRWDAVVDAESEQFYRIVINLSGLYVAYYCEGLEPNGITPKKMELVRRDVKLSNCKLKAQAHHDRTTNKAKAEAERSVRYSAALECVRLPYKD